MADSAEFFNCLLLISQRSHRSEQHAPAAFLICVDGHFGVAADSMGP